MKLQYFLNTISAGLSALAFPALASDAGPAPGDAPPNIILINVDDLGWTDVASYGSSWYETPNIDRLRDEGMKFTDAYAAAAVCSPTRAAILTGRYPARVGITDWIRAEYQGGVPDEPGVNPSGYESHEGKPLLTPRNPLWMEREEVTVAELLKKKGYATCHIGKWHLGPEPYDPTNQGFDENHGGADLGEPPSFFDPFHRPANPNWKEPALNGIPTLPSRKEGEYLTDREADEAVEFLRENRDRPFFINLAHYAVHTPVQGKPHLVEKYSNKLPPGKQRKPDYAAMVESVDDAVGRVMDELDALGLTDKTLIVFTSDNGGLSWQTNNSPLRSGKGSFFEGGIRVPLIVRWPGVVEPLGLSGVPVSSVDLLPTFCAAAGASLPEGRVIDGEDLTPLLAQSGLLERDAIFWHFPHYRSNQPPYSIIRRGDWKLIRFYGGRASELYHLRADIGEHNNLIEKFADIAEELGARLDRWIEDTGAKLPKPNPAHPNDI